MSIWGGLIGVGVLVACGFLVDATRQILRTLRRLEARMTLLKPLNPEAAALEREVSLRTEVEDRAIQSDVWANMQVAALLPAGRLDHQEYQQKRKSLRRKERTRNRLY